MGYYVRKVSRKKRIDCCAACRKGIRSRWWWVEYGVEGRSHVMHAACYLPSRDGGWWRPRYRCEADRVAFQELHQDVEVLRGVAQSGERVTAQELLAKVRQGNMVRAAYGVGVVAGGLDTHG